VSEPEPNCDVVIDSNRYIDISPTADWFGAFEVMVEVSDGVFFDTDTFNVTVLPVNDPPTIILPELFPFPIEDELYYVDFNATDIDGDPLTWSLETDAGDWLAINSATGELSGTPTNADVGTYSVTVLCSDNNGGVCACTFTLEVVNVNDPPIITSEPVTLVTEDVLYTYDVNATDIDPTDDVLTYTLTTAPTAMTINPTTGMINWLPTNDDVGDHTVIINVTDIHGATATQNFVITVLNTNDPPVITTTDVTTATEDSLYEVDYDAYDPDPAGDILTWSLATYASDWLAIDPATGVLSGAPSNEDVGLWFVNVSCTDSHGGFDFHNFTLEVVNVNDAPELSLPSTFSTDEDTPLFVNLTQYCTDVDNSTDELGWSITDVNESLFHTLIVSSALGHELKIFPCENVSGSDEINITVSDGMLTTSQSLIVFIVPINDAPVFLSVPFELELVAGEPYVLTLRSDETANFYDSDTVLEELALSIASSYPDEPQISIEIVQIPDGFEIHLTYPNEVWHDTLTLQLRDHEYTTTATIAISVSPQDWIISFSEATSIVTVEVVICADAFGAVGIELDVELPSTPPGDYIDLGICFNLTTDIALYDWLKLTVWYNESLLPPNLNESTLMLFRWLNGNWTEVENVTLDADSNLLTVNLSLLSTFAVFGKLKLDTDADGIPDERDPDDDNDRLPDAWEIKYGLNTKDATDASGDMDNDGITNVDEYNKGTDPTKPDVRKVKAKEERVDYTIYIIVAVIAIVIILLIVRTKLKKSGKAKI
jgi:hypothetical protein